MKMRTTQPSNNKYYIRKANGGYNGAVKGSPTIKGADVLCNCVGYANGRFGEIQDLGYIKYQLVCNAENFIEKAKAMGLKISPVPVLGGIMVWQKGKSLSGNDGAGHVAVVEKVINVNEIITSESGWASWAFKTVNRNNSNGRWGQSSAYKFRGCIINPAIGASGAEEIKSVTVDGEWGYMTTLLSQKVMKTTQDGIVSGQRTDCKKYLPKALTSSWEFSKNGKGSALIKAIQKLVGASADGIAGQNTVKAMQRFLNVQGLYTNSIDGVMGSNTVEAWQKWLNNPTYEVDSNAQIRANICSWAEKTASDNNFHYVKWNGKDSKTHECPICKKHSKGTYYGWNCIGFAFACWRHGGGIKSKCSCGVISDGIWEKILNAKTDAEALSIAREHVGINDIKVIRNKGNAIPVDKLQSADICALFKSKEYYHTILYLGDGKYADSNSGRSDNIKAGMALSSTSKSRIKVAIRYTGK